MFIVSDLVSLRDHIIGNYTALDASGKPTNANGTFIREVISGMHLNFHIKFEPVHEISNNVAF